jgi:hypothetical protein
MQKFFTLVFISIVIATSNLKAQTERGTLMIGGSASFQASDEATVFLFTPSLGVFVNKDFAIGLGASILSSDGYSQWALGPFARYYFGKNETGKIFGQGSLNISGGDGPDISLGGGLTGGYAFFLNQNIAIELAASYFRIGESGLFIIGAGFQIHFKKQKK